MRLYRSPPVMVAMVVMVVVSAWAKLAWARNDFRPLLKHFNIYGCQSNSTLFRNVNLSYLVARHGFFIGFGGNSRTTSRKILKQKKLSLSPCKLPPNVLFCAVPTTKETLLTILFHQVPEDDDLELNLRKGCKFGKSNKTADTLLDNTAEKQRRNQDGNKQWKEKSQQNYVTCNFTFDEQLLLLSGYGFISCQDDSGTIKELWRKWYEAVTAVEEEVAHGKHKTVVGVVSGTCVMAFLFLVCVKCRLRSGRPTPYHSQRRPSNTSGAARTASTHDHPSSRT